MSKTFPRETRVKAAAESRRFVFAFGDMPEIARDGSTLASAAAPDVTGLTLGTPAVNGAAVLDDDGVTLAAGTAVLVAISGGTAGRDYLVKVNGTTTAGDVLAVWGTIAVR